MHTCEIFIAINNDGGWIVTTEEAEALEKLGDDEGLGRRARVVKLSVKLAPPALTEVTIEVPDEAGQTVETEVA